MNYMEYASATNKALEQLEAFLEKMGGNICTINGISANYDSKSTAAEVLLYFNLDQLQQYISQLPPPAWDSVRELV